MEALSEQELVAEQERRRQMAFDLGAAMQGAIEGKGPLPEATVRHMLLTLETLITKVPNE